MDSPRGVCTCVEVSVLGQGGCEALVFYYFTVLMFIGFGQKKQTQQIVRFGSLSSSLPTRSMAATSSACVTAVQNASYLRSRSYEEKSEHLQI